VSTVLAARPTAEQIAARTPADRNRIADLLRFGSLMVVVVGHWLMAAVTVNDAGLSGQNVLVAQPWTRWLTWVFQVMPVFFFVGGYANGTGWASAQSRGTGYVEWLRARATRLLRRPARRRDSWPSTRSTWCCSTCTSPTGTASAWCSGSGRRAGWST
jgi:hypothetical protein